VLAVLFLNSRHDKLMRDVVRDVDGGASGAARASFFWTRIQGFLCLVLLILFLATVEKNVTRCEDLYAWLQQIVIFPASFILMVQAFSIVICDRRGIRTVWKIILTALIESTRNLFAFIVAFLAYLFMDSFFYG